MSEVTRHACLYSTIENLKVRLTDIELELKKQEKIRKLKMDRTNDKSKTVDYGWSSEVMKKAGNSNGVEKREPPKPAKSKFWAYFYWLFGGWFGAHHLYLGRDKQAFVWLTTFGGYFGIGWIRDSWRIPTYVADANDRHDYIEWWKFQMRTNRKPAFSSVRFIGGLAVGHFWAELFYRAIPEDEIGGINFRHLIILLPGVATLGVWVVGNIGRERGSIWIPLICTYALYPTLYYIGDESTWLSLLAVTATLSFDTFSKQWRIEPRRKRSGKRRFVCFAAALVIYASVWASFLYWNASITGTDGEEIKLSEAVRHLFTSPIWLDLKTSLWATWEQAKHQGFWETWRNLVDLADPKGEINAYSVLGLSQTASQNEISARWRILSKEHHPDKVKGTDEERRAAQEKFMEIQQAFEILSSKKHRRQKKNRRSDDG